MPATDLTARLTGWVTEAIGSAAMGEEFTFSVIPALTQIPGGVLPAWAVMVMMRSPLLGAVPLATKLDIPTMVMANGMQDQVRDAVQQAVGNLRKQHGEVLQQLKTGPLPGPGQQPPKRLALPPQNPRN